MRLTRPMLVAAIVCAFSLAACSSIAQSPQDRSQPQPQSQPQTRSQARPQTLPNPGNRPPHRPVRPPQWGHQPQQRPSYAFRPADRPYLHRYYLRRLAHINRARRTRLVIGGFFPYLDIAYISPLPPDVYRYLPPPPPGYRMGYYEGYVVVYDPVTFYIANVIDLLQ